MTLTGFSPDRPLSTWSHPHDRRRDERHALPCHAAQHDDDRRGVRGPTRLEEAQLTLADPVRLGWVLDETGDVYGGVGPNARLRLAAQVTTIGPATGHPFARLLTTPAQAAALLGWARPEHGKHSSP